MKIIDEREMQKKTKIKWNKGLTKAIKKVGELKDLVDHLS